MLRAVTASYDFRFTFCFTLFGISLAEYIIESKKAVPEDVPEYRPQEDNRHDTDASVPPISIKTDADRLHALRLSASAGKFAVRADRKISVCLAMDLIV